MFGGINFFGKNKDQAKNKSDSKSLGQEEILKLKAVEEGIKRANSVDTLIAFLESQDNVSFGSANKDVYYWSRQIQRVVLGQAPIQTITSTFGLKNKVVALIAQERNQENSVDSSDSDYHAQDWGAKLRQSSISEDSVNSIITSREQIAAGIEGADSLEELYIFLKTVGEFGGGTKGNGPYWIKRIEALKYSTDNSFNFFLKMVTRENGLRDKVAKLFQQRKPPHTPPTH